MINGKELQKIIDNLDPPTENDTELSIELDKDTITNLRQVAKKFNVSEEEMILAILISEFS